MQTPPPAQDLELDEHFVEDAIAFIDAFYSTSSTGCDGHSPREVATLLTAPRPRPLGGLREAVDQLCDKLLAVYESTNAESDRLRALFKHATATNDDVEAIHSGLQLYRRILERRDRVVFWPLQDKSIANTLRRQLDELTARAASAESERPLLQRNRMVDWVAQCDVVRQPHGVVLRFRSGRHIPFKLSVLTRAAWSVVSESSFATPGQAQALGFNNKREIFGCVEYDEVNNSHNVAALRRVDLPNGDVLICYAGIYSESQTDTNDSTRLFRRSEAYEMGWVRVGRVASGVGPQPRAFIETVCDVTIVPADRDLNASYEVDNDRFERFRSATQSSYDRQGRRNRQLLENRMLEATLASSQQLTNS